MAVFFTVNFGFILQLQDCGCAVADFWGQGLVYLSLYAVVLLPMFPVLPPTLPPLRPPPFLLPPRTGAFANLLDQNQEQ